MATRLFNALLGLAFILLFGGLAMVIAGSICVGDETLCVITKGPSIAVVVCGIVAFLLSIAGFLVLLYAWIGGVVYSVTS